MSNELLCPQADNTLLSAGLLLCGSKIVNLKGLLYRFIAPQLEAISVRRHNRKIVASTLGDSTEKSEAARIACTKHTRDEKGQIAPLVVAERSLHEFGYRPILISLL